MAKMVVICLESPLGGGQYLNTILLDPLQNKASSATKRPASSRPQALVENRATNDAPSAQDPSASPQWDTKTKSQDALQWRGPRLNTKWP